MTVTTEKDKGLEMIAISFVVNNLVLTTDCPREVPPVSPVCAVA